MANKNYSIIVGLDIGTGYTKVIIGRIYDNENNFEILGLSEVKTSGVSCGNITNLFKLEETINEAITAAENSAGISIKSVNISLFGNYIKIGKYKCNTKVTNYNGIITSSDVNRLYNDISNITTQPNCRILNIVPILYDTDSMKNIVDPIGMISGNLTCEYNIVDAQSSVLNQFIECLSNCGIEVETIMITPEALANVVLSNEEKEIGTCLIDIGAGSTDVSIFKNNVIQNIVSVPFGGNSITNDIKTAFGITFEQAENLKIKYGDALFSNISKDEVIEMNNVHKQGSFSIYAYDIAQIIDARVKEIMKIIADELLKQKVLIKTSHLDIILVGGTSKIKNICKLIESVFSTQCRLAVLNENYKYLNIDSKYFQSLGTVIGTTKTKNDQNNYDQNQYSKNIPGKRSFFRDFLMKTKKILID